MTARSVNSYAKNTSVGYNNAVNQRKSTFNYVLSNNIPRTASFTDVIPSNTVCESSESDMHMSLNFNLNLVRIITFFLL